MRNELSSFFYSLWTGLVLIVGVQVVLVPFAFLYIFTAGSEAATGWGRLAGLVALLPAMMGAFVMIGHFLFVKLRHTENDRTGPITFLSLYAVSFVLIIWLSMGLGFSFSRPYVGTIAWLALTCLYVFQNKVFNALAKGAIEIMRAIKSITSLWSFKRTRDKDIPQPQ